MTVVEFKALFLGIQAPHLNELLTHFAVFFCFSFYCVTINGTQWNPHLMRQVIIFSCEILEETRWIRMYFSLCPILFLASEDEKGTHI